MKGKVAEIFKSVQGEGLYVGEKQVFVRLAECNLSCGYCDTKISAFSEYEPRDVLEELSCWKQECQTVSFTGGEPLLQKEFLKEVLLLTREAGFKNYLETNGTLPEALEEVIDNVDIVAMDFKFPSSTGAGSFWRQHEEFLRISSRKDFFVKTVISRLTSKEDLWKAIEIIKNTSPGAVLVFQPDSGEEYSDIGEKIEQFKNICIAENVTACIIPQLHKIIGVK